MDTKKALDNGAIVTLGATTVLAGLGLALGRRGSRYLEPFHQEGYEEGGEGIVYCVRGDTRLPVGGVFPVEQIVGIPRSASEVDWMLSFPIGSTLHTVVGPSMPRQDVTAAVLRLMDAYRAYNDSVEPSERVNVHPMWSTRVGSGAGVAKKKRSKARRVRPVAEPIYSLPQQAIEIQLGGPGMDFDGESLVVRTIGGCEIEIDPRPSQARDGLWDVWAIVNSPPALSPGGFGSIVPSIGEKRFVELASAAAKEYGVPVVMLASDTDARNALVFKPGGKMITRGYGVNLSNPGFGKRRRKGKDGSRMIPFADREPYKPGAAWKHKSKAELIDEIVALSERLGISPSEAELRQMKGMTKAMLNDVGASLRREIRRRAWRGR